MDPGTAPGRRDLGAGAQGCPFPCRYMVDAADQEKIEASKNELHNLLDKPQLQGIPVSCCLHTFPPAARGPRAAPVCSEGQSSSGVGSPSSGGGPLPRSWGSAVF